MKIAVALVVFALVTSGFSASSFGQSLADMAQKEKERREKVADQSKPITNSDTAKYKNGSITTGNPQEQKAENIPADSAPQTTAPDSDEPVDLLGRPESFWRTAFSEARKRVKDLENEANVLTLRVADLQNRFYAEANGFTQQGLQKEIQKTLYEQDLNSRELEKSRAQLDDLEKEARKNGALPGWLTPTPLK